MKNTFNSVNNSVAVLPFINIGGNPDHEYFSDGMTEEIINGLSKIENLKVISRTSSFSFKNRNLPLKDIADQLKVNTILEGSIRVAGEKVRISAKLIDAQEDFNFWSESWDRKLANIFEVQDEVSLKIADKLREYLGHLEISDHLIDKKTENIEAYNLVLEARYHFNKWNPEDVKRSIEIFENALKIDDKYADAYVGLADAYSFLATTQFISPEEGWRKSIGYVEKARSVDNENPGVYYLLANVAFFTECNFKEAVANTFKSLELKPGFPEARQFLAFLYTISGEIKKAREHLNTALSIDPLNRETQFYKAYFLYRNRQWEEAKVVIRSLLDENPLNIPALMIGYYIDLMQGKYEKVIKSIENSPKEIVIPDEKLGITCLANILSKNKAEYLPQLKELEKAAELPNAFQAHSNLLLCYANLDQNDKAFFLMDKIRKYKSSVVLLSFTDPLIGNLSKDKRYEDYRNQLYEKPTFQKKVSNKKQLLDPSTAAEYKDIVVKYITNEQPYLNPTLSLRNLAEEVEIHPNQLSWLLNELLGKKFNEFINQYRIEHFKELLSNPENSHISIIGLAYESGFNSKTVFNTFFKKVEGITPKEYLNTIFHK